MRYFILLILILSISFSYPQNNKYERILKDFRGIPWNASKEDVKKNENAYYLQLFSGFGIEALSYKGKIAGLEARIDYTFRNNKLIEGSYSISSNSSFKSDFISLTEYLSKQYGKPDYMAGPLIHSDSVWIKENNYGKFRGPELYWKFKNGFIGLHSSRFRERITTTILFVYGKTIEEYGSETMPYVDEFKK